MSSTRTACASSDRDGRKRMSQPSDREERQTTCWCSTQQLYDEVHTRSLRTEGHRQRWKTTRRRRKRSIALPELSARHSDRRRSHFCPRKELPAMVQSAVIRRSIARGGSNAHHCFG